MSTKNELLNALRNDENVTGNRIRRARKNAGLTQKQLGDRLGISYQTIAQWENCLRNPKRETLKRLANALGIDIDELVGSEYEKLYYQAAPGKTVAAAFGLPREISEILIKDFLEMGIKPEQRKKVSPRAAVVGDGFIVDDITPKEAKRLTDFAIKKMNTLYQQTKEIIENNSTENPPDSNPEGKQKPPQD